MMWIEYLNNPFGLRVGDCVMRQLGNMMEDADPKQRETLKKCMRELERD